MAGSLAPQAVVLGPLLLAGLAAVQRRKTPATLLLPRQLLRAQLWHPPTQVVGDPRQLRLRRDPGGRDGAVFTGGSELLYNTTEDAGNATSFSRYPQTDLLMPITTAGDLSRIQASVGTLFAGPPGNSNFVLFPTALWLNDPAYTCPKAYPTSYLALVTMENNANLGRLNNWWLSWERRFEYRWADGVQIKKPIEVSAPKYVEYLMDWIETQLDDESIFPQKIGSPFPRNFREVVKTIFKRLFRVYAHIYHSHFQKIVSLKEEAHLNTCFKHFTLFTWEFKLIDKAELAPLIDLIESIISACQ